MKGNLDWTLERDGITIATIDLSTTAARSPEWKYGHALKSAFYAMAVGADHFCEWVFSIGMAGKVTAQQAHWFALSDVVDGSSWRDRVEDAITRKLTIDAIAQPIPEPPIDPINGAQETWRCGKVSSKTGVGTSYCSAQCPRNAAWTHPASVEVTW